MQKINVINENKKAEFQGLILGMLAITAFSVTLPATRLAVMYIDPVFIGLGRSLFITLPALLMLYVFKMPLPTVKQWRGLVIVMLGVVIGFPWLTSLSMQNLSGAQGGIVVSMLPLFTAIVGAFLLGNKPSFGFWLMAILGSALVMVYLLMSHEGRLQPSELILLGASVLCAIGYAQGGKLASDMGGFAVITWALVLSAPFSFFILTVTVISDSNVFSIDKLLQVPWQAWLSFLYLSVVSQWMAFILWYKGLALGGVVRVSQVQLVQPFFTLMVAAILLGERISLLMILFTIAVVITVGVGRRMPVHVVS